MAESEILKNNLENRVAEMVKSDCSEREIAEVLSKESGQIITKSSVHRYLSANVRLGQEALAVSDKLKVAVMKSELDTINSRHELIDKIRNLGDRAEEAGDLRTALLALGQALSALDSLDKRLGKFSEKQDINLNIELNQEFNQLKAVIVGQLCPICKEKIKGRLHEEVTSTGIN